MPHCKIQCKSWFVDPKYAEDSQIDQQVEQVKDKRVFEKHGDFAWFGCCWLVDFGCISGSFMKLDQQLFVFWRFSAWRACFLWCSETYPGSDSQTFSLQRAACQRPCYYMTRAWTWDDFRYPPRQSDHPEKLGSPKCRHGQSCQMACHTRQLRARFSGHFQMWLALIETGVLKEFIHWKGTKIHHNTIRLFGCSEGACLWIYGNSSPLICSNFQGCSCTSRAIWSGSFLRGRWRMSRDGGRNLAHLSTLHLRYDMMRHDMLRHLCYDSMILWCYVTSNDLMCYKITWDFSSALVCHVKTLPQAKKWQHAVALLQELKAESGA